MREIKFQILLHGKIFGYERLSNTGWESMCLDLNPDVGERWNKIVFTPCENLIRRQYTGLKDEIGKEIYEGDIIKMHRFIEVGSINGSVEGEQVDVGFISVELLGLAINCESQENSGYLLHFYGLHEESYEIIGNIYQHPELLK